MRNEAKINYLEGIRGISILIVVLYHHFFSFLPSFLYPGPNKIYSTISGSPLNILFNGHFAVYLFFILSGYVLSYRYLQERKRQRYLQQAALRRYFRLFIPVFISMLIAYGLMKFNLMNNKYLNVVSNCCTATYYQFKPDLFDLLRQSITFSFDNVHSYNIVLWIMKYEFIGSYLVFGLLSLFSSLRMRMMIYIFAALILIFTPYSSFVLGIILAEITFRKSRILKPSGFTYLILLIGILLGSFPNNRLLYDTWYQFINWKFLPDPAHFYHIIGAFLVLLAVLYLPGIQFILKNKLLVFFGKISFAMFLIHYLVISSIDSYLYFRFLGTFNQEKAFLIILPFSFLLITGISYGFFLLIDKKSTQIAKMIAEHLNRKLLS